MKAKEPIPPHWLSLIRQGDRRAIAWALVLEERGGLRGARRTGAPSRKTSIKAKD